MEIEKYIKHLLNGTGIICWRGDIINDLAEETDTWVLVLKALLIKNPNKYINKCYLLEKLNFMKNNPKNPSLFLDYQGDIIYRALLEIPETKIINIEEI